jgi:hypothetical protein
LTTQQWSAIPILLRGDTDSAVLFHDGVYFPEKIFEFGEKIDDGEGFRYTLPSIL